MELFRPDKPISLPTEDKFQRYEFSKRIADIVSTGHYPESLVVGIYGKWGEGKSSILNFIKNEISSRAVIINFNPWLFSDEKQLIKAFFEAIAISVGKKLKDRKQRAAEFFTDYADSISSISELIIPYSNLAVQTGKRLSEKFKKDSIEDLKVRVDDLIKEADVNFVVFIDDIDRLDVSEVQAIFKLVKLAGDFPRTAYVLAFDDNKVAAALGPRYAERNKTSGYEFLEKIIQVPLQLPKANATALRHYTLELLDNAVKCTGVALRKREVDGFIQNFDRAFLPALNNPRLGVRFANSVGFSLPLLHGEVHLGDLMTIEGIKTLYPELYHFIRNNQSYFLSNYSMSGERHTGPLSKKGDKEKAKANIDEILAHYVKRESVIEMLMDLFPQLRTLYENYSYTTETYKRWYREMRICSPHHFERYFSYVVRRGDISDVYFKNLLSYLTDNSIDELKEIFAKELTHLNPEGFLFKLDQHTPSLSSETSIKLAKVLALLGASFPATLIHFSFSPRTQASFTIKRLIWQTSREKRFEPCNYVIQNAKPLSFALEIYDSFNDNDGEGNSEPFIIEKDYTELTKNLADRLNLEITETNIWDLFIDFQLREALETISKVDIKKTHTKLLQQLHLNSTNSLKIIKIFTPTIMEINDPKVYKGEFSIESYTKLKALIEPQLVYEVTIKAFGKLRYDSTKNERPDRFSDENLIALFQQIHIEQMESLPEKDRVIYAPGPVKSKPLTPGPAD